jgi:putative ABC transport system permease protein
MTTTLLQDARYGARFLLNRPSFALVAVFTIALGIGANTAIFSLVHAVLLRPLSYPEARSLVVINDENAKTGETFPSVSPADFFDWKSQCQSFSKLAAYSGAPMTLLEGEQP